MPTCTGPGILHSWEQRERNQGQIVCESGSAAFVAVVKPADLRKRKMPPSASERQERTTYAVRVCHLNCYLRDKAFSGVWHSIPEKAFMN